MFNLNSPTVQAMLKDIPQGVGNMPVYYGNTPTVEDVTQNYQQPQQNMMYQQPMQPVMQQPTYQYQQPQQQPMMMYGQQYQQPMVYQQPMQPVMQQPAYQGVQPQACTPYPSPKEMLMQSGPYMPTTFSQPRNIVGGYNPGFQQAFENYYNPYMGQGYSGYGYGSFVGYPRELNIHDQNSMDTYKLAMMNGLSYKDQIENEINVYKTCSRVVSNALGRSEEYAKRCEATFDPYDPYSPPKPNPEDVARYERHSKQHMVVKITRYIEDDDGNMKEVASKELDSSITCPKYDYNRNVEGIYIGMKNQQIIEANKIARNNYLYDHAIEREYDNYGIIDFFNKAAGHIAGDMLLRRQSAMENDLKALFDRDKLIAKIRQGRRSKDSIKAEDDLVIRGANGIMPDGRPVSPGHDPSIAECFTYNPRTGKWNIEAPGFIKDRLYKARNNFLESLDKSNRQAAFVKEN